MREYLSTKDSNTLRIETSGGSSYTVREIRTKTKTCIDIECFYNSKGDKFIYQVAVKRVDAYNNTLAEYTYTPANTNGYTRENLQQMYPEFFKKYYNTNESTKKGVLRCSFIEAMNSIAALCFPLFSSTIAAIALDFIEAEGNNVSMQLIKNLWASSLEDAISSPLIVAK